MKVIDQEHKHILREEWLSGYGLDDGDVMVDIENGKEYIYQPIEGEYEPMVALQQDLVKVELPFELQSDYFPF